MIWFLLVLAILPVLWLVLAGGTEDDQEANPVAHYKRQLVELDEELATGQIDKDNAASARLEIERRILRLADQQEARGKFSRSGWQMPALICAMLILASAGLYGLLGSPEVKSQPGERVNLLAGPVEGGEISYGEAIQRHRDKLESNPADVDEWAQLAQKATSAQAYAVAANAYGELVRLEAENSNWRVNELEAFLRMAGGQVTPAANMLLEGLLQAEPNHPAAHYYLGIARLQAGDKAAAKSIWTALLDRSPEDAPWVPTVMERLVELDGTPPKLSQGQIDDVASMSPEQQQAFVRSMIERLETRLESAPEDVEGWIMLARSQAALGEQNAAISTLTRAIKLVKPEARPQLQAILDNLR